MGFLNQRLILNSEIFDLRFSLGQLNSDFMSLVFDGFMLSKKNVSMDLNFLLPLLHGHFQLVLLVLQSVYVISSSVKTFLDLFDLKLHNVVLDQNILFFFRDLI